MSESSAHLQVIDESRVDAIESIVGRISDFEQDELRAKLATTQLLEYCQRVKEWRNCLAVSTHTALFAGVAFGTMLGAFYGLCIGLQHGVLAGLETFFSVTLSAGAGFGLVMGLYCLVALKLLLPRIAKNLSAKRGSLCRVQELRLPLSATEAFEASLSVIAARKGTRLEAVDRVNGALRAVASSSWRSPGELVGAKIDAIDENSCRVRVYSKSLFTSFDFGKTKDNVERLAQAIEEAAQVQLILNS